jgi:hypothetical protein
MPMIPNHHLPVGKDCRATGKSRPPVRLQVLTLAVASFAWLCGSPGLVSEVQATCTPSIIYAYDTAGRLSCVYNVCAANGVNYNYDSDGNVLSIATATSCQQNTMRSVSANKALASSGGISGVTTRHADHPSKVARVAGAGGEKQRNLKVTAHNKHQAKEKPLAVSLR